MRATLAPRLHDGRDQPHVFTHVRREDDVAPVAPLRPFGSFQRRERVKRVSVKNHRPGVAFDEYEDETLHGGGRAQAGADGENIMFISEGEQVFDLGGGPGEGGGVRADRQHRRNDFLGRGNAN